MQKTLNEIPWVKLPEKKWDTLPTTGRSWWDHSHCMVTNTDLEIFLEYLYRELSRILNVGYEAIKSAFMQENSAFFLLKSRLYPHRTKYFTSDPLFKALQSLLIVPDVYPNNVNHITIAEKRLIQASTGTIEYEKYEVTVRT